MKILEGIISFLQFEMTKPIPYGWFHIMSMIIMVVVILFLWYKKVNTKKLLLVFSIIMIAFEVYKQLSFSYNGERWEYQWYAFPFQFCSVPMYVALFAALTKNKKLEKKLFSFLATYGLVAGIAVMLYPETVFVKEVLINVQTMIHHGFMVVMGAQILINKDVEYRFKTLLNALEVFIVLIVFTLIGNISSYYTDIDGGLELFYISPFHTSTLPVFNIIYEKVPYIIFLVIYIASFSLGAYIPIGLLNLVNKKRYKR